MKKNIYAKIKEYVKFKIYISKTELITFICNRFGLSKVTAIRKIDYLIKQNELIKINKNNYKKYNINEEDKRIVYIGLKQSKDVLDYVNDRLYDLKHEKISLNKNLILKDISLYKDNLVYVTNISDIIDILILEDIDKELTNNLVYTLFNLILKKHVIVDDKIKLINCLKKLLNKHKKSDKNFVNLKRWIIYILAHFNDKQVFKQFKYDLLNENEDYFKHTYSTSYISEFIHENRNELYKLQLKLNTDGLFNKTNLILQVRSKANEHLNIKKPKKGRL